MRPTAVARPFSSTRTNETENDGNCEENHQAGTCDESRQGQDPGRDGRPSHQGHLHQGCSDQSPGGSVGRRAQGRESRAGRPGNHRARSGQQEGRGRVHAARPAQDRRAEGARQAQAQGHQPVHQGRAGLCSKAGDRAHQGTCAQEAQGRRALTSRGGGLVIRAALLSQAVALQVSQRHPPRADLLQTIGGALLAESEPEVLDWRPASRPRTQTAPWPRHRRRCAVCAFRFPAPRPTRH